MHLSDNPSKELKESGVVTLNDNREPAGIEVRSDLIVPTDRASNRLLGSVESKTDFT
jgi:hypothetical protein